MNYLKVVEECKKLTDMATFATFDSFKVIHEEMRKTGGTIFNIFNPVGISGDNLQEFDKIVDNIWLNKDKSTYYLSRNTVKNYCLDVIQEIHVNGEDSTKNNAELRTRWEELLKKEMKNYTVIFPIYGVTFDKVTPISLFTAYNFADFKTFIENLIPSEKILCDELLKNETNYLVFQTEAKDSGRAMEIARPYFELFEYISKFWIDDSLNLSVGIFKYKKLEIKAGLAITQNSVSASFDEKGAYKDINISVLTKSPTMSRIWEIMTKYIQGRTTEIETRLINAIRWVGMANSDDSNVTKHVQYVFAIEALLSHKPADEIITPSISHKLAESAAFIIGEIADIKTTSKKDFRAKIFHEVKHIYSTRSKVAHGNDKNVNVHEITRAHKLINNLICAILQNDTILKFNSMNKLDTWIENLKFSS